MSSAIHASGMSFLSLALVAVACGGGGGDSTGVWVDSGGEPVPTSTIVSIPGPEHCDWQDSTWIVFGGELYLKDPQQVVAGPGERAFSAEGSSAPATEDDLYRTVDELPPQAQDSGLRYNGTELWTSPAEHGAAIYLVADGLIERIPRTVWRCI